MRKLWTVIFLAASVACNISVEAQPPGFRFGKYNLTSEKRTARIPFEPDMNHVIISAEVNGTPGVRLILDTGMPMPGLILVGNESVSQIDMGAVSEIAISDGVPGREPEKALIAEDVTVRFPGLELTNITTIVEPAEGNLAAVMGGVDGIIGLELFGQFAVTIDYDSHEIVLVEPGNFRKPAGAEDLLITIKNGLPWLECSAEMMGGAVVPVEMVVDLGAQHALSLNAGTHEDLVPPDNAIDALLGRTVSGGIFGKVGRIKTLHLGGLMLRDVVSSFQTGPRHGPSALEKHGNLGNGVLRRFNVTFNYADQRMTLVPNRYFKEPFEYNMSGVIHSVNQNEPVKIIGIVPGSPAAASDLGIGDIISSIDGRPCGEISRNELRKILTVEGADVRFEAISPDGTAKDVTLTLRRII